MEKAKFKAATESIYNMDVTLNSIPTPTDDESPKKIEKISVCNFSRQK